MKSYSAYFVRAAAVEQARAVFGASVQPLPDSPWLLCAYQPDDELPDEDVLLGETSLTQAKSEALGEVFFVYGDTCVDWFIYEHAQDGELLRKLVWATLPEGDWDDCGWALAEGAPGSPPYLDFAGRFEVLENVLEFALFEAALAA